MKLTIDLSEEEYKVLNDYGITTSKESVIHKLIDTFKPKSVNVIHTQNAACGIIYCPNCGNRKTIAKFAFPLDQYCSRCGQHFVTNQVNWSINET